ncbi:MAG TPA: 50S ribosomal protein L21 [Candidatus Hydrothermia bacterium]|mgnify:CR=1 FL=1|nr:50S ribosomal protein L21 [Candidatus Hydrothermae bacterium]MDD3649666.1 50S ribosomal protein L21 [Candidatus Hydrothermia bacterium]MDD5572984.1 50S ribosomal protein L21 [Candidatus Hydrothermia bacterium]HOK23576.1 50S ribosomal protein L21 [Candidatus Hydrothermia bacterium]HOL24275.1 50S ribosomal protein L21 [Candidatus Hydrothermia bacterium]
MKEAVFEFKGFQYRVKENDIIKTQKVAEKEGDTVEIGNVILVQEGDKVTIGSPYVGNARVVARIMKHYKDDKVTAFRFVNKENVRKKRGHRQELSKLKIEKIIVE